MDKDQTEPDAPPLSGDHIHPVPSLLQDHLAPARWTVHEWQEYFLTTDAVRVQVGSVTHLPTPPGNPHYRLRFENQLGLATIRQFDEDGHEREPIHLEVLAAKLGTADASIQFLEATLSALYAKIAATPFVLAASTERLVKEERTPPTPLFVFHFFRHHGREVMRAVQTILGSPHQRLTVVAELVRPHQVRQVDHAALMHLLQTGRPVPMSSGTIATLTPLQRLRPERVLQQIPEETWDTPENRFVRHVGQTMQGAITTLRQQSWWSGVATSDGAGTVATAAEYLTMLSIDHRFATVGPMTSIPMQSRVLQKKDGYRDLALLWQLFQHSREPLFQHLQQAISLRSIDQLYELWVLFELLDQIGEITGVVPVLAPKLDAFGVPTNNYAATFGEHGTLFYNRTRTTYSGLPLRPDYLWVPNDGSGSVALDAKFRLRQPAVLTVTEEEGMVWEPVGPARATTDDLTKMHAYRDAISGVRAAVVLYPGTVSVFRSVSGGKISDLTLRQLLIEKECYGIGAIATYPVGVTSFEEAEELRGV